jgi:hypothetical protein
MLKDESFVKVVKQQVKLEKIQSVKYEPTSKTYQTSTQAEFESKDFLGSVTE